MKQTPLMELTDGYKLDHRRQYPDGTEVVYSNFTPRNGREARDTGVIFFGLQYLLEHYFQDVARETFFDRPKTEVLAEYQEFLDSYLGPNTIGTDHVAALHDLGYVPLQFKAVPEGTFVPYGVPVLTVENTHPDFFWVTNYFETLLSSTLWQACTSATTARKYRISLDEFAERTADDSSFVDFQAHDFSLRGMPGMQAGEASGAGHILSFTGSDNLPSIRFLRNYYDATGFVAGGVPATEHSVMCAGGPEGERETYKRLFTIIYPDGYCSAVSDTFDYWGVLTIILPSLHDEIMERDGTAVIRPDSGDPVLIICGDPTEPSNSPEGRGTIQILWDEFGGTINKKGFKVLDSHIRVIYGDSITLDREREICERLEAMGFSTENIVFGVGSYTYQLVTRDTHGFAMKATWVIIYGAGRIIQKTPKTDKNNLKKSARGKLVVIKTPDGPCLIDDLDEVEYERYQSKDMLRTVWEDGEFVLRTNLEEIRELVRGSQKSSVLM